MMRTNGEEEEEEDETGDARRREGRGRVMGNGSHGY